MRKYDDTTWRKGAIAAFAAAAIAAAAGAMETMCLDGLWDFRLAEGEPMESLAMPDFAPEARIPVPGCWDAMSHWYDKRGTGCYRRSFSLDGDAANAFVVVDGFCLRLRVWLDGRELGTSLLPWSRVEFPTGPLKAGEHELAFAVDNTTDGGRVKLFLDYYDFYPFGGLHHGVRLEVQRAPVELRRVAVRTRDYKTGRVELEALFAGEGAPSDFAAEVAFDGGAAAPLAFKGRRAEVNVPRFRLWSHKEPNLHTVEVRHGGASAKARFGVRQVATDKGRVVLNGEPVYVKGVNRHESHPEFGASTPRNVMYDDIMNLKDLGGNFIRGSHYPQCEEFLDLCDELGVLVWEESLGWGNRPDHFKDAAFCDLQEEQTRLMVRNSINHPCVVMCGFLNEPASQDPSCKELVERLAAAIRTEDSGRLVTFACNRCTSDIAHGCTDVIAYNAYPGWYSYHMKTGTSDEMRGCIRKCHADTVKYFRGKYKDDRPIIVSESGVKADYGVHDPRGRAQYTEDFQAEYERIMLEELFKMDDIAGIAIWQFTDCRTYTRRSGVPYRSYGVNTGGLYDLYRRPKLVVEAVRGKFKERGEKIR